MYNKAAHDSDSESDLPKWMPKRSVAQAGWYPLVYLSWFVFQRWMKVQRQCLRIRWSN